MGDAGRSVVGGHSVQPDGETVDVVGKRSVCLGRSGGGDLIRAIEPLVETLPDGVRLELDLAPGPPDQDAVVVDLPLHLVRTGKPACHLFLSVYQFLVSAVGHSHSSFQAGLSLIHSSLARFDNHRLFSKRILFSLQCSFSRLI